MTGVRRVLFRSVGGEAALRDFSALLRFGIQRILIILFPVFLIGVLVAFTVDLVQVKWKPTTKPLRPKFSKLNPISGFKRFFSKEKVVELLKAVIKILLIGYVAYSTLLKESGLLFLLYNIPLVQSVMTMGNIAINFGLKISMIYLLVGFDDLLFTALFPTPQLSTGSYP